MQTRGKPASRLQAIDGKPKLSEGFGPLWAERMRFHEPCASRLGKDLGILEWPKTRRVDSRQAFESFATDRWQTEIVGDDSGGESRRRESKGYNSNNNQCGP